MAPQQDNKLGLSQAGMSELINRLAFVFLGIFVYRVGAHIPVPGLDPERLAAMFNQQQGTVVGLLNMFSGGALQRLTIFAIGIMPYISASIIIQLMSVIVPSLEQLKKEGESGRTKMNQYTRYLTVMIATVQSLGMAKMLVGQGIAYYTGMQFYFTTVVTLTTGTMFLMWLGEQITERGIGNGISLIIFSGIVSRLPSSFGQMIEMTREGQVQSLVMIMILLLMACVVGCVVFIERGQRRLKVNYPQRTQGRRVYAAQTSHLPLKINISGVIPPIFASSLILMPATLSHFVSIPHDSKFAFLNDISIMLQHGQPLYMVTYAGLIIFFAFFYTALVYNPKDTADNLKKSGAYIPGVRPGVQTASYIDGVMSRLTFWGAAYLVAVCLLPDLLMYRAHMPFYFGGTSLLIVVVVVMDFIAQLQSHLMSHQYESLIKKANLKGFSV